MILTCPACAARFLVDPGSIGAGGRPVRCGRCRHQWFVPEPAELAPVAATPAPAPSPPPPPRMPEPEPPLFDEPDEEEAPPVADEPEFSPPPLGIRDEDDAPPRRRPSAARERASLPAVRRAPRRWPARLAWLALIALLVAIGAGATHYRDRVVAAWPAAERLYAAIGMEAPPLGHGLSLVIENSGQVEDGGAMVLSVSGRIENTSETTREVPGLRAALFDAQERELQHWTFRAPAERLLPKEQVSFQTRFRNPSKDAVRLSIVFHEQE